MALVVANVWFLLASVAEWLVLETINFQVAGLNLRASRILTNLRSICNFYYCTQGDHLVTILVTSHYCSLIGHYFFNGH